MPSLMAVLGLDANPFKSGLSQAQIHANRMGKSIGSALTNQIAGYLSVAAVGALVKGTVEWASKLRDVADGQRVNVEWLQKLTNGAELYGGKLEDVEKVLDSINKMRADPTKDSMAAFSRLGFSTGDVAGMNRMDFVNKLIKRFSNGFDDQSARDLELVGGKSARNLLAAFAAQFENDTPILAESFIDQLDDIGDKFTQLGTLMKVELAPAIVSALNLIISAINKLKQIGAIGGGATAKPLSAKEIALLALPGGAGIGAFIKGRLSSDDATDAAANEMLSQQANEGASEAAKDQAKKNRKRLESGSPGFSPFAADGPKENRTRAGRESLNINSLQQVGAYVAQTPERREMLSVVKEIKKAATTIAMNTKQMGRTGTINF